MPDLNTPGYLSGTMDPLNLSIGIDVGSVAVKIVVLRDGAVIEKAYCRFTEVIA